MPACTWKINFKLKPNVTLSYGLRFESQTQTPDHADFAPRLGTSWAISRDKRKPPVAVIRSGFGLFYQRFPSINVLEAARQNGVLEQDLVLNDPLSAHNDALLVTSADGKMLLHMRTWMMAPEIP